MTSYTKSQPIFIVGAHRSATSHIKKCVQGGFDIPANTEGYIWSNISALQEKIDQVINVTLLGENSGLGEGFSIKKFGHKKVLDSVLKSIDELHQQEFQTENWLDKTPGPDMIKILPILNDYFTNAKIIYCSRDCIQNLESRRIRFQNSNLAKPINNYAQTISNWQKAKNQLKDNFIIIEQEKLASSPELYAKKISSYIGKQNNDKFLELLKGSTEKSKRPEKNSQTIFDSWTSTNQYHFFKNCFFFDNYNIGFNNLYVENTNEWTSYNWDDTSDKLTIHPNSEMKVKLIFPNIVNELKEGSIKCTLAIKNKFREEKVGLRFILSLHYRNSSDIKKLTITDRFETVSAEFIYKQNEDCFLEISCESLRKNIFYNGCELKIEKSKI